MIVSDGILEGDGGLNVHIVVEGVPSKRMALMLRAALKQEAARILAQPAACDLATAEPAGRA